VGKKLRIFRREEQFCELKAYGSLRNYIPIARAQFDGVVDGVTSLIPGTGAIYFKQPSRRQQRYTVACNKRLVDDDAECFATSDAKTRHSAA